MIEFDYTAPETFQEALEILDLEREEVAVLAGGTNLLPNLRLRKVKPRIVMDINRIQGLKSICDEGDKVRIGPLVPISDMLLSPAIARMARCLCMAAKTFANPLIRNVATIGGNLANASPAADMAVPLLTLEAQVKLVSQSSGSREIPLDQFFMEQWKTVIHDDELIQEISFTKPKNGTMGSFLKLGRRNSSAISIVSAGVLISIEDNRFSKVRIAVGAVAPTPIRLHALERIIEGERVSPEIIERSTAEAAKNVRPITDIRGRAEYRCDMVVTVLRKMLRPCLEETSHEKD